MGVKTRTFLQTLKDESSEDVLCSTRESQQALSTFISFLMRVLAAARNHGWANASASRASAGLCVTVSSNGRTCLYVDRACEHASSHADGLCQAFAFRSFALGVARVCRCRLAGGGDGGEAARAAADATVAAMRRR